MKKKRKQRWDANWDRLKLETKINKLRDRLNYCYIDNCAKAASAERAADTALYVANLSR